MIGDISLAVRALGKNPGFVAVAGVTLAIGIGANTAVFSLFEALMLRALPVERPGELAVLGPGAIGRISKSDRPQEEVFSFAQFQAISRDNNGVLAEAAATPTTDSRVYWGERLSPEGDLLRASCVLVSGSYFPMLGVRPYRGRLLGPEDDGAPGTNPVAVVSHAFWRDRLGSAASTVGSAIRIQDIPYTIVGIAEPSFLGHTVEFRPEIWVPLSMQAEVTRGPSWLTRGVPIETYWLNILMRLKPGISFTEAESAINARLQQVFLEQSGDGITEEDREQLERIHIALTPMRRGLSRLRATAQRPLALLWVATGLVMLVVCANLGGLLLVRAADRRHEFGIRRALGGSLRDLIRPLLAESAILAAVGVLLGCAAAHWMVPVMHGWLLAIRGAQALDVGIAWPELFFATGVGTAALFVFGLAPAVLAVRKTAWGSMRSGGSVATSAKRNVRARSLLVAAQCALAVILLTTAGLFLRSLADLRATDLGVDADRVIGIRIDPQGGGFARETEPSMRRRILERVATLPGVESTAFTGTLPLQGNHGRGTISIPGYAPGEDEDMGVIHVLASPDYFATLGIRLLDGRIPHYGEPDTVVVNQAFAARFFPDRSALGAVINENLGIAGIVSNVRQVRLQDDPPPLVYVSTADYSGFARTIAVRSSLPAEATAEAVRRAVREVVPGMPVDRQFTTVALHLERAVAIERMLSRLVGSFAGVALLLAAVGLFGVCSHMVRSRTREIGIRMALGASVPQVQVLLIRSVALTLGFGALAGVVGAVATGRLVAGMLYEADPVEWGVVAGAVLGLAGSGALATAVPALRMPRVRPSEALRHE